MRKLMCLLIVCFLVIGGVSVSLADDTVSVGPGFSIPHDSSSTPMGGGDEGIGGGAGWPC
ncbi:MAG: hypothetical protein HXS53_12710 [Theionarchaea archaeon]|nr:hypothetical protein [Theionarchaea archaeon]